MTDYYLPMTVEEICRDYRTAKDKKNQIEILADRNLCTKEVIEDILRSRGEELMDRTHKAVEQKLSKMHISLRQQSVNLEALPTEKDILKEKLTESVDNLDKSLKQAKKTAELAAKDANAVTPEVNLEDIIKDFKHAQAEGELRRLREDAVSDTLLTLLFDTLYSTDLNASLETVFARFGIKLLDYLKER